MNPNELESRIAACNLELRREWYWIAIFPLIVFFFAIGCLLLKFPPWSLVVTILITPFLMSIQLTKLVNTASVHAGLVCPHCGTPLGGYVKQARCGVCLNCSAQLFDHCESAESSLSPTQNTEVVVKRRSKTQQGALICAYVLCLGGSAFAYWLAYRAIETGHTIVPKLYPSGVAYRQLDPKLFWISFVAWLVCGTSPLILLAILRYRINERRAQQVAPADRHPVARDVGG